MSHLELFSIIIEYDPAIAFFVDVLGFDLIEDSPAVSTAKVRPKRWVVVRPPNAQLARMGAANVTFVGEPRDEAYGRVVVFFDIAGNRWDLLGPRPRQRAV